MKPLRHRGAGTNASDSRQMTPRLRPGDGPAAPAALWGLSYGLRFTRGQYCSRRPAVGSVTKLPPGPAGLPRCPPVRKFP